MNRWKFWRGILASLVLALPASGWASKALIHPFPRPKDASAAARLEPVLAEVDRTHAAEALECWKMAMLGTSRASSRRDIGFFYEVRYRVLLEDRRFLSVKSSSHGFCASAHPSFDEYAEVYDLVDARKYDPLRLYRITQPGSSDRRVVPELEAILVKRILAQFDDRKSREECAEVVTSDFPSLTDGSLGFTPSGLMFLPLGVVHAVKGCFDIVILPYEELGKYLDRQEAARVGWTR